MREREKRRRRIGEYMVLGGGGRKGGGLGVAARDFPDTMVRQFDECH